MKKLTAFNKRKFFYFLMIFFVLFPVVHSDTISEYQKIQENIDKDEKRLVEIFKDIHANPELGFQENRTANIVDTEFKNLGYQTITGIGKTGVAAIMKNGDGPIVMYRADIDGLAVKETTGLPYASTKVGKLEGVDGAELPLMHACGHDAHVTWMLGAAKVMSENKDKWKGTLVFIAQPAEEPGLGARAMVEDNMYKKGVPKPDYLIGMHTAPIPVGTYVAVPGARMAGMDQIDVVFNGVGGHGSAPQVAKDPVIMSAIAVTSYQSIVSRAIDPQNAAVLTVGSIQAGTENNVIPASSLVKINLRWFNENDRNIMVNGIQRINEGIAFSYGLNKDMYPKMIRKGWAAPLVNDKELTERIERALQSNIKGIENLKNYPPAMGSEDFHHLVLDNTKHIYSYILVGVADPKVFEKAQKEGKPFPYFNHNGNFMVDLKAIPYGVKMASISLLDVFNNK